MLGEEEAAAEEELEACLASRLYGVRHSPK
jgi:hypothetical protein